MRSCLMLAAAAAACSSKPSPLDKPPVVADDTVRLEQLISSDAIGVLRQTGEEMFVLRYVDQLVVGLAGDKGPPACWTDLLERVKTGYQLSLERSAYFIVEGNLPAADVASCVKTATMDTIVGKQEGDLYVFTTPAGAAYAAWRGPYVVVGEREQVEAALKTSTAESAARWKALLSSMPSAPTYMVRIDHSVDDLVGGNTTHYAFAMDKMQGPPNAFFAGRFIVQYKAPADAEAGERRIREWSAAGKFPRRVDDPAIMQHFDSMAVGIQKTRMTRTGKSLEIAFDSDMFGGAEAMAAVLSNLGN